LITIIEKHQIFYLHPKDILYINKGQMPSKEDYVEVHFKSMGSRLEILDMKVKNLHNLLTSGKFHDLRKQFRRV
jgi:hypothetical protein